MSASTAVQLHLSEGAAAVSSPRLGTVTLPKQLAQQRTLLVEQQQVCGAGNATQLLRVSEQQLCAWLNLNSHLLSPAVATRAARLLSKQHSELAQLDAGLARTCKQLMSTSGVSIPVHALAEWPAQL